MSLSEMNAAGMQRETGAGPVSSSIVTDAMRPASILRSITLPTMYSGGYAIYACLSSYSRMRC